MENSKSSPEDTLKNIFFSGTEQHTIKTSL